MNVAKVSGTELRWWCPGCQCAHIVPLGPPSGWMWNGDLEAPTLSPSVLVKAADPLVCHCWVVGGRIEFLADCTHDLEGQTVPMGPISGDPA